uniref:F-box and leucine rich repeat protein 6 n=1 Tax=Terrapene triunguis TaxID=2587831 RepID=A0A674K606_9SAUR
MEWLVLNRFSLLRDFALCHWKSHVPVVLQALAESCPLLLSLKLTYCNGVTTKSLSTLAERCPRLESLNLQNSQVDSSAVVSFLEAAGSRIRQLWLTYSSQTNAIIATRLGGCCLGLVGHSCPHLFPFQVLRLLNMVWSPKPSPRFVPTSLGFPQLEELCLASTSYSFISDGVLQKILQASTRLRVLDLRGCFRVTPKGLQELPCPGEPWRPLSGEEEGGVSCGGQVHLVQLGTVFLPPGEALSLMCSTCGSWDPPARPLSSWPGKLVPRPPCSLSSLRRWCNALGGGAASSCRAADPVLCAARWRGWL